MNVEDIQKKYVRDEVNAASFMKSMSNITPQDAMKMVSTIEARYKSSVDMLKMMIKQTGPSGKISKSLLANIKKTGKSLGLNL